LRFYLQVDQQGKTTVHLSRMDEKENPRLLTSRERRFVGIVLCFAAAILFVALLGLVTWALAEVIVFFSGVIWPLAVAGILSIMLRPVVSFFEERLRLGRTLSVLALYALVLLASGLGSFLVAPKVLAQVDDLTTSAPEWPRQIQESLHEWLPQEAQGMVEAVILQINDSWGDVFKVDDLNATQSQQEISPGDEETRERRRREMERNQKEEKILKEGEALAEKASVALAKAKAVLFSFFKQITYLAIIPIYMFYFLGTRRDLLDDVEEQLGFLRSSLRSDLIFLTREFVTIVVAFFRGQLLIAMIMGSLYALGFYFAGLQFGLALGLLFGLLNVVPYLGSIVGLSVVVPLAYFQEGGGLNTLGFCMSAFAVVQLLESYYLTPKIMGRQTGMHPVVVIVAIFFWGTALGGILGMIAAIPLTAFLIVAWRLLRLKYLGEATIDNSES
jgi:predicted PurR-regulated permease PerM